jgi:hypothetical protein
MKKTIQILVWVGFIYYTYKRMYPNGLPSYELDEPNEPNHETDKITKNSPAHAVPKKPKKSSKKIKSKSIIKRR